MTDYRKLADTILHLRSWGGLKDVDAMTMDEWKAVDTALRLCADRSAPASSSLAQGEIDQAALEAAAWELQRSFGREGSIYGIKACEEIARLAVATYRRAESAATPAATKTTHSDTPRMDATLGKGNDWVFAEGCRLERELAEADRRYDELILAPGDTSSASTTQEPWSAPCGCTDRFMCVGHVLEIRAKNTTRDTPPTTTCNEPVAWAMYAIDTEELVCVNAIPPDDREGLRIEPLYLASSASACKDSARLDYIGRTLHIDATGDEPIYAMFIPGTEGVKDKSDLRGLIDNSMALDIRARSE